MTTKKMVCQLDFMGAKHTTAHCLFYPSSDNCQKCSWLISISEAEKKLEERTKTYETEKKQELEYREFKKNESKRVRESYLKVTNRTF